MFVTRLAVLLLLVLVAKTTEGRYNDHYADSLDYESMENAKEVAAYQQSLLIQMLYFRCPDYSLAGFELRSTKTTTSRNHQQKDTGDVWQMELDYGEWKDDPIELTLLKRNDLDCIFIVKMSILDENRQSKLELVKRGWNQAGSKETFLIPYGLLTTLTGFGMVTINMMVIKVMKPSMAEELLISFKSESFGNGGGLEIECADGVKFHCHKDILAAKSHLFATMFNVEMEESVENRLHIQDFSSEVISVLLRFVYLGDWGDLSNVADRLYKAADRYQLEQLKLAATAELIVNLNAESIVSTLQLAHLYKDELLADGCVDYLASHKGDFSAMEVMAEAAKNE